VIVAEKHRPGTEYRATLENAIHMIDLMRWGVGEAKEVVAASSSPTALRDLLRRAHRFERHARHLVPPHLRAVAERLETFGGGRSVIAEAPERFTIVDESRRTTPSSPALAMGWARPGADGVPQEVEDFLRVVKHGGEVRTPARDALESIGWRIGSRGGGCPGSRDAPQAAEKGHLRGPILRTGTRLLGHSLRRTGVRLTRPCVRRLASGPF